MIYVMECGPVFHRGRECWLVFSIDMMNRSVKTRVMQQREEARREVLAAIGGAPAHCCASLGEFGRAQGWRVGSPPDEVLTLAALTLVGLENQEQLGMLAFSPVAEVWLRSCAVFLEARPWEQFTSYVPLQVTFTGRTPTTRVVAVGGAGRLPPSLTVLKDHEAFARAHSPEGGLDDSLLLSLGEQPGVTSEALGLAFGETFHPRLLRLRRGKPRPVKEEDLLQLAAALAAIASLASGRAIGRAVVGDLEAIVVPPSSGEEIRN